MYFLIDFIIHHPSEQPQGYLSLSICLFVNLSICQSVYLSICLYVYLSICLSVYLSICLSVYLPTCLSVYLSIGLLAYQFICVPVYLSIGPSAYQFICVSVFCNKWANMFISWISFSSKPDFCKWGCGLTNWIITFTLVFSNLRHWNKLGWKS